jgi:hypothetical protein
MGCIFSPRCDYVRDRCQAERPQLRHLPNGSWVRCHFAEEIDPTHWTPSEDIMPPEVTTRELSGEPILVVDGLKKYYEVAGNCSGMWWGWDKTVCQSRRKRQL